MKEFLERYKDRVVGVLNGFDRMRFRGSIRQLMYSRGMQEHLWRLQVKLMDFKKHVLNVTEQIREATIRIGNDAGRQNIYLPSPKTSKVDVALQIAKDEKITDGLICILRCVEPCRSFFVKGNRETKHLDLNIGPRKCAHYYFYLFHRLFGFMSIRLQTWYPFTIWICMNGREWLSRDMDKAGIKYMRRDNCFVQIEDIEKAQQLAETQRKLYWEVFLAKLMRKYHPCHDKIFSKWPMDYYWSMDESQWATDVMFRSRKALAEVYPQFVHHAIQTFSSQEVMRFLGRKLLPNGEVHHLFDGELVSDMRRRKEGVRVKHRIRSNWIKMYDKQGSVLRIETIVNDPHDMKVYRAKEGDVGGKKDWRPMRKGVADVYRRGEICQAANGRYLNALAAIEDTQPLGKLTKDLCRRVKWKGRYARGLNPFSIEDAALLKAVSSGKFTINGFRNKDIRAILFGTKTARAEEVKRQSGKVTRKFRLLRAHGLIRKIPRTHRYMLTDKGRTAITALIAAENADAKKLLDAA